jgi:hypothetical protein
MVLTPLKRSLAFFGILSVVTSFLVSFTLAGMFSNTAVCVTCGIILLGLALYHLGIGVMSIRRNVGIPIINKSAIVVGCYLPICSILSFIRTVNQWPAISRGGQFAYALFISLGFFLSIAFWWMPICKALAPDAVPSLPGQDHYQWAILLGANIACSLLTSLSFVLPKRYGSGYEKDLAILALVATLLGGVFGLLAGGFMHLRINRAGYEQDMSGSTMAHGV